MAKKKQKPVDSVGLKAADIGKTKRRRKTRAKVKKIVTGKSKIKQYIHEKEKRVNNPPVGLVTPESDQDLPAKKYSFDPHLDPQLQWSGKVENSDFEVDTVSLHRHERIDPMTIIGKVLKNQDSEQQTLFPFFEKPENILPLRNAIEFYKHDLNWSNRLIAGDSLLVMNSLLEKEGMEGKVQMIYIDPPYGIKYKSNFQPFVNKKDPKDGKDEDLSQEPETIRAFRDTWELGIHSFLTYLRNRFFLSKKLLNEKGSIFVQISDSNAHFIRILLDEVFGSENFVSEITFRKKLMPLGSTKLEGMGDYLIWYAKDISKLKYHQLFLEQNTMGKADWSYYEDKSENAIRMTKEQINNPTSLPKGSRIFKPVWQKPPSFSESNVFEFGLDGKKFYPPKGGCWITNKQRMNFLKEKNRLMVYGTSIRYKLYLDDFPYMKLTNIWNDTMGPQKKLYAVQTGEKPVERCILMTTDPGDLVFDPTCGSGTIAYLSEKWGRRWLTCDSSRIATTITRQRLLAAIFDYYELRSKNEGLRSGFKNKTVPHTTLKTIANNDPPKVEEIYDRPVIDKTKVRVTGPFTVEAVPSPTVKSLDTMYEKYSEIDSSIARTAESKRQQDWRDELLNTGVRGKGGQKIEFLRVEPHPASQWIHAMGETKESKPKIIAISFGPEYSPLEQKQVALAIAEAQKFVPKPELIIFASLQFDPEAAKDIDELQWPGVQVLKVQVNADLFTSDLKKKRASNESFWLMGQPDVELKKQKDGKYIVEVKGFDYYNTKSGDLESGDSSKIAMWMLDTDYDERSLYPQQVFFPMSGTSDGWSKLAKTLKSEINEQLIEHYSGTRSLPFSAGANKQVAIKIIDDRGIESLKIIKIE